MDLDEEFAVDRGPRCPRRPNSKSPCIKRPLLVGDVHPQNRYGGEDEGEDHVAAAAARPRPVVEVHLPGGSFRLCLDAGLEEFCAEAEQQSPRSA